MRLRWLAALAVVLTLMAQVGDVGTRRVKARISRRPNVLVIVTDDQRGGLSVMPEVTRHFVRQGTRFPNAYVTTPLCCPSRASIISGRYLHNHHVTDNNSAGAFDEHIGIQRYLAENGYRTAMFGKFLNRWDLSQDPLYLDSYALMSTHRDGYYNGSWNVNGNVRTLSTYGTDFIGRRANRFLRAAEVNDRQPWLMYLAPAAPHGPYTAEPRYADARVPRWGGSPSVFEKDLSDKPPYVTSGYRVGLRKGRRIRRAQFRTLMSVDDMVEKVFKSMEARGEMARTLAFTSPTTHTCGASTD